MLMNSGKSKFRAICWGCNREGTIMVAKIKPYRFHASRFAIAGWIIMGGLVSAARPATAETMQIKCVWEKFPTDPVYHKYWMIDFTARTVTVTNAPNGDLRPMPARITPSAIDWQYVTNMYTWNYHIDRASGVLTTDMSGKQLLTLQCQPTRGF
jgi:hypothetical protein